MKYLNRTNEESLALTLWELRKLPGLDLPGLLSRRAAMWNRYVDAGNVRNLLSGRIPAFADIARRASSLSGAELDSQNGTQPGPLRSVFSRLRVDDNRPEAVFYPPVPLSVDGIFLEKRVSVDTKPLLDAFERELSRLDTRGPESFDQWMILLDTLLKKHFWSLPASAGTETDVSLYDRLKVTAAVGTCLLCPAADPAKPYLLMAADFSGIQNYIFSVSRMGVKGVSKRLRARSFWVDVMVQSLACRLCERLGVPQGNLMMLTGGKFHLLLPNSPEILSRLQAERAEIDRSLYARFRGDIFVNMAWVSFGDDGLREYSGTVTELSRRLRENKRCPFRSALTDESGWKADEGADAFLLYDHLTDLKACPSCARRLIPRGAEVCDECGMQEELGGKLATADQIWLSREGGEYRLWDFCYLSFQRSAARGPLIRVEQLNSWTLPDSLLDTPLSVRLMANHLPKEHGEPLTFSDIAKRSAGLERIAVLKADVDNLGYLFADGMREPSRHYGTISRVSALSRLLDLFFSGYVGHLLKTKYPNVYSVFSGGDDLFLIGPWNEMPKLALDVHDSLDRLSGHNPCVTLSAAVCVANPKANISLLASHSEAVLHTVKNSTTKELYPGKKGRDGVAFLGDVYSWEDLGIQLNLIRQLESVSGNVDIGILRRLARYSEMYRRFLRSHDVMGLMFEPLFHYDRVRNYARSLNREKAAAFLSWAEEMRKEASRAANYKNVQKNLFFAQTVVTCYLNETKAVRNHGE